MPNRFAIRASAVLALAASLATLLFSLAMASALLLSPIRYGGPLPPNLTKALGAVMAVFLAAAGIWGIAVAVGVFRRRNWARVSMAVFGGLLLFFGGTGALAMLLVPYPMNPDLSPQVVSIAHAAMLTFYLLMAVVGASWLVVFNRQSGKRYFAEAAAPAESVRPLSIGVIGWYLITAAAGTALWGVFRIPTILFGFVVTGWTTLAVCTALTAVQLYLGAGLLQLDERARVWTIVYFCAMGAHGLAPAVAPEYPARMREFAAEFQKFFHMEMPLLPNAWLLATASVAYAAILIWFLVRRRAAFADRG
jgi:hypothetical protein